MFAAGPLLFSGASLLGGFATGQWWLLAARAVQGAGGAVIAPNALVLISTTFPEGQPRNRAMGVYSATAGGGGAVGLLLGGILASYNLWVVGGTGGAHKRMICAELRHPMLSASADRNRRSGVGQVP